MRLLLIGVRCKIVVGSLINKRRAHAGEHVACDL